MSTVTRWDPMRDVLSLRDAMGQLFEQAVMRPSFESFASTAHGAMNIVEAEGRYYCQIALPGIAPDDIELTVRQNTLTVKANVPEPLNEDLRKNAVYLVREFGAGEYTRTVTLPKDVNGDHVDAHYEHGILTVVIPLAEHAQPRRIAVRGGDAVALSRQVVPDKAPVPDKEPVRAG